MKNRIQRWRELSREIAFRKYSRIIEKVMYQLPDGKEVDFYLKKEGPAVAMLALTKDKKVILTEQFRPGPNEILKEMPGGLVENNETPVEAALRELLEETGYAGKAQFVGIAYECAYSTMKRYCVVVIDCEKVDTQNLDDTEFINTVFLSLAEFRELLRSGKMTDIEVGYMALDHLGLL